MHPKAVLLGIVMGSTVSMAVGLLMTLIVFLALPEHADRLREEFGPLLRYSASSTLLAALAVAAFYGELKLRPWRRSVQWLLWLALLATAGLAWLNIRNS
jgi:drug/metabolite transporter (DMT)-like permease